MALMVNHILSMLLRGCKDLLILFLNVLNYCCHAALFLIPVQIANPNIMNNQMNAFILDISSPASLLTFVSLLMCHQSKYYHLLDSMSSPSGFLTRNIAVSDMEHVQEPVLVFQS